MKKMIATNSTNFLVAIFFIATIISCGDNKYKAKDADDVETINSGKISVIADESIWNLIQPATKMYLEKYNNVEITDTVASARAAMSSLFATNHRVAIIGRDYLPDEIDLMNQKGMEPHQRIKAVEDALVLAVNDEFPLVYTQDSIIKAVFQDGRSLKDYHEEIDFDLNYFIKGRNHSEHSNFEKHILEYKDLKKKIEITNSLDEILSKVSESKENIGLVYLSQVVTADTNLNIKMLPIGFVDSTGSYKKPAPVHPSYIVQGRYPYVTPWYIYLLEDRQNLPFWFAKYVSQEQKVVKYYNDLGVLPSFARFKLIPENK